jgi:membrane associated rhomboid family serine protease
MSGTNIKGGSRFWEVPHTTVNLLIIANVFFFSLCALASRTYIISNDILFHNGGMYRLALDEHEYWRLFAYGFLHFHLLHLVSNMICLVLWGAHLEKRVGSLYFIIIYCSALVCGALISHAVHQGNYLSAGASGAISGVLGALLCLWILAKIDLSASFFILNIGINAALTYSSRQIDWGAHVGGFAAGFIVCALLDLFEKTLPFFLRCKFPEFIKVNSLIVLCLIGAMLWEHGPFAFTAENDNKNLWLNIGLLGTVFLAIIKLIDFMLSLRRGLAVAVIAFALANAGLCLFVSVFVEQYACAAHSSTGLIQLGDWKAYLCLDWRLTASVIAAFIFVLTLTLYAKELIRGLNDVGFIGATFAAERRRRYGL